MPASKATQEQKFRNRMAFRIGYLGARYMTADQVAAELGLTAEQVVATWQDFGLTPAVLLPDHALVDVSLSGRHRTLIAKEAKSRGMELPDFVAKVLATVAADGLFGAVLD